MITALLLACTPEPTDLASPPAPPEPAPEPRPEPPPPPPPSTDAFAPATNAALNAPAPDFALESADGLFQLSAHTGNVILLELSGFY